MRLKTILPILILSLSSILILSKNIDRPFWGHHDWNSNIWTVTAKNNIYHGLACTRLGQSTTSQPISDCSQLRYYMNHPPLISWLLTISYATFGFHEWAGRLPLIFISTGSIILIFLIGKFLRSTSMGLVAGLIAMVTPMFQYFGKSLNHEPLVLFSTLLAFYLFLLWQKSDYKKYFLQLILSTILIGLSGWQGFFILPVFLLLTKKKDTKARMNILKLIGAFVLVFTMHQLHNFLITGQWNIDLFNQLLIRTYGGQKSDNEVIHFSYPNFFRQQISWIRAYYTTALPFFSILFLIQSLISWEKTKKIINSQKLILGLFFFGLATPLLFSQQAYIHDYLNMYLLPFFAIATSYFLFELSAKFKLAFLLIPIVICSTFWEKRAFLTVVQNRDVEKQYVYMAWFINQNKKNDSDRFLIEADNYYNFAYPFLWNYSYNTYISDRTDTLESFMQNQKTISSYDYIITVDDHPISNDLQAYLQTHFTSQTQNNFTIFSLSSHLPEKQ